ncbi:MAG: hypothetical protein ACKOYG_10560 [Ilumatobacteraceae bacterium]
MLPDEFAALRRRADTLRRVSARLRDLVDDVDAVRRRADERTWRGPAASTFEWHVDAHRQTLDSHADALASLAWRWDSIG